MNKRSAFAIWGPVVAAMLLVAAAFATGILDRQRVFEDMIYTNMRFEDGRYTFSLEQGDAYGLVNDGETGLNLPEGTYRLRWEVEGDGDNILHISCNNGALITPGEITLPAGQSRGEVELTVKEACVGLNLGIEFASGTYINVVNLRMYSPFYNDNAWTLLFVAVGLSILWVLCVTGRMEGEQLGVLIFVALAVLIAERPRIQGDAQHCAMTPILHMARIENLVSGLRSGQFPVRAGGHTYNGYGRDHIGVLWRRVPLSAGDYAHAGGVHPICHECVYGRCEHRVGSGHVIFAPSACLAAAGRPPARRFSIRWPCTAQPTPTPPLRGGRGDGHGDPAPVYAGPLGSGAGRTGLTMCCWGSARACIFLCHMISTLICAMTAVVFCLLVCAQDLPGKAPALPV